MRSRIRIRYRIKMMRIRNPDFQVGTSEDLAKPREHSDLTFNIKIMDPDLDPQPNDSNMENTDAKTIERICGIFYAW